MDLIISSHLCKFTSEEFPSQYNDDATLKIKLNALSRSKARNG